MLAAAALSPAERDILADQRLPLYERVKEVLWSRIATGMWRPGDMIPSETHLAQSFGVAQGTVRRAIQDLVDERALERQHGRGTFVRRADMQSSLMRFFRFQGGEGAPVVPDGRVLSCRVESAPPALARTLGIAAGGEVIVLLRLRLTGGEAFLAEDIFLPRDVFAPLLDLPLKDLGPLLYPLYESRCGQAVARAEEILTVSAATATDAERLGIPVGAPVVQIDRTAFDAAGRPLEWRRSRGRGDRFSYRVDIK